LVGTFTVRIWCAPTWSAIRVGAGRPQRSGAVPAVHTLVVADPAPPGAVVPQPHIQHAGEPPPGLGLDQPRQLEAAHVGGVAVSVEVVQLVEVGGLLARRGLGQILLAQSTYSLAVIFRGW